MVIKNITLPMIRNIIPNIIAQDIIGVQPMTAPTSNIFNIKRKIIVYNKKYWPYQYNVSWDEYREIERWCWTQFKGRYWHSYATKFVFKRKQDAALFALRWINESIK